jgi:hypothetical protein
MAVKIDLTGDKYGKLTVIELAVDEVGKKKKWRCICECGRESIVAGSNLRSGHTVACMRCRGEATSERITTHGKSKEPIYRVWESMKSRCERPEVKSFKDYGGRGISVCEEWHDPSTFFGWAMSNGYKSGMEIDRIDVNGNYCPDNCRLVSRLENSNNKTNNKVIEHNGEKKTLAEWARYYGVNYKNLSRNLKKGYTLDEAVNRDKTGDRTHKGSRNWTKKNKIETLP